MIILKKKIMKIIKKNFANINCEEKLILKLLKN